MSLRHGRYSFRSLGVRMDYSLGVLFVVVGMSAIVGGVTLAIVSHKEKIAKERIRKTLPLVTVRYRTLRKV